MSPASARQHPVQIHAERRVSLRGLAGEGLAQGSLRALTRCRWFVPHGPYLPAEDETMGR